MCEKFILKIMNRVLNHLYIMLLWENVFGKFFMPWTIQIDIKINMYILNMDVICFAYETEDYACAFLCEMKEWWKKSQCVHCPFMDIILTSGNKSLSHIPFHILSTATNLNSIRSSNDNKKHTHTHTCSLSLCTMHMWQNDNSLVWKLKCVFCYCCFCRLGAQFHCTGLYIAAYWHNFCM